MVHIVFHLLWPGQSSVSMGRGESVQVAGVTVHLVVKPSLSSLLSPHLDGKDRAIYQVKVQIALWSHLSHDPSFNGAVS